MKETVSAPVSQKLNAHRQAFPLRIHFWLEDSFSAPVHFIARAPSRPEPDWDSIESVGAADDASRFRIDLEPTEIADSNPGF